MMEESTQSLQPCIACTIGDASICIVYSQELAPVKILALSFLFSLKIEMEWAYFCWQLWKKKPARIKTVPHQQCTSSSFAQGTGSTL